ncbi:DUF3302 domain-containing protein [Labrenzia sp. VG12]|uniref:DUF3302 domain-containing protein n=1 Tax=Labrenzia sp. VG12 TaxID=2021862 RepID=UPI0012FD0F01|nr:DUF3302 domain-containing protein [Labrenzia sp. VG12]
MDILSVFALVILLVLATALVGIWVFLALWPGKIAAQRNHPKAAAVAVCGYWGALTLGILMPLAFIWAHADGTDPSERSSDEVPS